MVWTALDFLSDDRDGRPYRENNLYTAPSYANCFKKRTSFS